MLKDIFILFMEFSRQKYWSGLPFPFSSGPHFVRTLYHNHPSWVALNCMVHSFIELNKAVVHVIRLVQFSSVAQSCPTLCNPMNCSTPGLPVHRQLLEFTQTHVHWTHAIQQSSSVIPFSSCCQSLPAPESFPMSQLFTWGGQSTRVSALASFLIYKVVLISAV